MQRYLDRSRVMRVGEHFAKLCEKISISNDMTYPELTNKLATQLENEIKLAFAKQKR